MNLTSQSDPQVESFIGFDAMCGCQNVERVDQSSATNIDGFLRVLLQNSRLPWIFTELRIAIHINWVLDSSVDSLRVSSSTSAVFSLLTSELTLLTFKLTLLTSELTLLTSELVLLTKLALLATELTLRAKLLGAELLSLISKWLWCTQRSSATN